MKNKPVNISLPQLPMINTNLPNNDKNPPNNNKNPPNNYKNPPNEDIPLNVDCSTLTGLRGLAALHILVFHALFSSLSVNTMGSIEMPLFFLLSGFSLAVTYGRTKWDGNTSCCCGSNKDEATVMKSFNFYRNRFARVGPIYFLANLIYFLMFVCAYGLYGEGALRKGNVLQAVFDILGTLTGTGSWMLGFGFDICLLSLSSWTVSTLLFFYLVFPILLPRLQRFTDDKLYKWITILFFIQLSPVIPQFILRVTLGAEIANKLFWPASVWPVSRLPVFIMGVLAGLQCLRGVHNPGGWINSVIPWSYRDLQKQSEKENMWRRRVDGNSFLIILSIIIFCVLNSIGYEDNKASNFSFYSQFFCVHMQLMIIVGLTSDGGRSFLSKVCKWKPVQLLGRVSMTLYLIHVPVMDLIKVAQYRIPNCSYEEYQLGKNESFANNVKIYNTTEYLNLNETNKYINETIAEYKNVTNPGCEAYHQLQMRVFPLWAVPVLIILCPFLAWIITVCIEEPARAWFRVKPITNTPKAEASRTKRGAEIIEIGTGIETTRNWLSLSKLSKNIGCIANKTNGLKLH